jgi:hypothetical protein
LQTLLAGWDRYHLDDQNVTARAIFVDTASASAINFAITAAEQAQLFDSGQSAATSYLAAKQPQKPTRR